MSTPYNIQKDLKEARAMVEGLSDYVRGDELYGNTSGGFFSTMPKLTIGALLLRINRLNAFNATMPDKQSKQLDTIIDAWQAVRSEWRSHYEHKILWELESRLESMQPFFRECAESQHSCANNFRPELQKRTIIQELLQEMDALNIEEDDIREQVTATDGKLRTYLRADDFQWSDDLLDLYPKNTYWWLYQRPPLILHEE